MSGEVYSLDIIVVVLMVIRYDFWMKRGVPKWRGEFTGLLGM